jgi:transcriptional regulator with XRE-family HTH domain
VWKVERAKLPAVSMPVRHASAGARALARFGADQTEMAERLKISQPSLSKLLRGLRGPSDALKARILKQYGVDWDAPPPPAPKRRPKAATVRHAVSSDPVQAEAVDMLATVRALQTEVQENENLYPEKKAKILASCAATLASLGRLTGESLVMTEGKIVRTPQFKRIVSYLEDALAPWPDALQAVTDALREFD